MPFTLELIDALRCHTQLIREGLEIGIRDGELVDMTPEEARTAINFIRLFEDSMQADEPLSH